MSDHPIVDHGYQVAFWLQHIGCPDPIRRNIYPTEEQFVRLLTLAAGRYALDDHYRARITWAKRQRATGDGRTRQFMIRFSSDPGDRVY